MEEEQGISEQGIYINKVISERGNVRPEQSDAEGGSISGIQHSGRLWKATCQRRDTDFYIARGSLYELETHLYIASDLDYINEAVLVDALEEVTSCKQMLNGLIKYFRKL